MLLFPLHWKLILRYLPVNMHSKNKITFLGRLPWRVFRKWCFSFLIFYGKFRNLCLNVCKLDSTYFYSNPNLNEECVLFFTEMKLGLLRDVDLLFFRSEAIGEASKELTSWTFWCQWSPINTFENDQKRLFGAFYDVTSLVAVTMQKLMFLGN